MSSLTTRKIIVALEKLGNFMAKPDEKFNSTIQIAQAKNGWFSPEAINKALSSLSKMLNPNDLNVWLKDLEPTKSPKKIGLILAGNIPLVGFHDVISVLATGNIALVKMSSSDEQLLPALLAQLMIYEPAFSNHIQYVERLKDFDAIIATGSNNTSRYFDYYFGKVPHIIRKNRNSVAVLNGKETVAELEALGHDILDFYGLGCRNVAKIYFPKGYRIENFFEGIESFQPIINHFKYNNNYDYNKSIYLINGVKHYDNGFLLVKEDEQLSSPLAVLYYEEYVDKDSVAKALDQIDDQIQCVVTNEDLEISKTKIAFGESQNPKLWDYADDVDTIAFLKGL